MKPLVHNVIEKEMAFLDVAIAVKLTLNVYLVV